MAIGMGEYETDSVLVFRDRYGQFRPRESNGSLEVTRFNGNQSSARKKENQREPE
jgi:hypothetical protein